MSALSFPRKDDIKDVTEDDWLAAGLTNLADKFVIRITHYARRMESIIPRQFSHAYDAANVVAEMSIAIFTRINALRLPKTTKQMKQRALVDLFKCLKDQGYSSMKWSVPSNARDPHSILQLPVPSFSNSLSWDKSAPTTLEKGESYFHRCHVELSRLRFEISMIGSQYMSLREMTLMQGYSEYILFMICQQRCSIATMIQSVADIETIILSYDGLFDSMPFGQKNLIKNTTSFESHLSSLVEGLHQTALLIKESLPLVTNDGERGHAHDTLGIIISCASILEENYASRKREIPITFSQTRHISTVMTNILSDVKSKIISCMKVCGGVLPTAIFDSCLVDADQALSLALSYEEHNEESEPAQTNHSELMATIGMISSVVQSTLITVQSISTSASTNQCASKNTATVCGYHKEMLNEFSNLRLEKIYHELSEMSRALIGLHDNASTNTLSRSLCTRATINSFSLIQNVLQMTKAKLGDALLYYSKHSKLLYVLLRVFRVLISKGFCSDDVTDGGEGDGSGGAGDMKFEDDVDGTGMGEGEGKNDVTDELESEEQLLGLKGDENQEASSSKERKELKEDEVDTGMEMEQDFDGENYDLPDQPDQKDDANSENEEELDRVSQRYHE
jgi:midasin